MIPVYCINLEIRKDRKEHAVKEFSKLGIDNVIYPVIKKHIKGGAYGCFESHMKVFYDFFYRFKNENYCLIFEDDFVSTEESKNTIYNAIDFINNNYNDIDLLFLHNFRVNINNKINTDIFTNGYGVAAHAYIVTRHYISSIIKKNYKLPDPCGMQIDFQFNINKNNLLYSEKIFFTNNTCFLQLVDESDNKWTTIDSLFRQKDVNKQFEIWRNLNIVLKNKLLLSDNNIKFITYKLTSIFT
jgi:GR25 family glycosyltransferase involved in LPS biosynthesis